MEALVHDQEFLESVWIRSVPLHLQLKCRLVTDHIWLLEKRARFFVEEFLRDDELLLLLGVSIALTNLL